MYSVALSHHVPLLSQVPSAIKSSWETGKDTEYVMLIDNGHMEFVRKVFKTPNAFCRTVRVLDMTESCWCTPTVYAMDEKNLTLDMEYCGSRLRPVFGQKDSFHSTDVTVMLMQHMSERHGLMWCDVNSNNACVRNRSEHPYAIVDLADVYRAPNPDEKLVIPHLFKHVLA